MELSKITVIDFETSGLDPVKDRVIEMAALRCEEGKIVSQFCTLVKFQGLLSPKITEMTGITDRELRRGFDEDAAFQILINMIGDNLIVAHNAIFDLRFLHFSLMRLTGKTFRNPFLDTLTICRLRQPFPHTLQDMCKRYGIHIRNEHRALHDAMACWELLKKLNEEKSVAGEINKLGYTAKYGLPDWYPEYAIPEMIEIKYA